MMKRINIIRKHKICHPTQLSSPTSPLTHLFPSPSPSYLFISIHPHNNLSNHSPFTHSPIHSSTLPFTLPPPIHSPTPHSPTPHSPTHPPFTHSPIHPPTPSFTHLPPIYPLTPHSPTLSFTHQPLSHPPTSPFTHSFPIHPPIPHSSTHPPDGIFPVCSAFEGAGCLLEALLLLPRLCVVPMHLPHRGLWQQLRDLRPLGE